MSSKAPEGWRKVRLGDVANINPESLGQRTHPDFAFGYIDISQIDQPGICTGWTPTAFATAPSRARRIVREGDIIVSTVRPYLRAFAKVPPSDCPLIASTGFAVVRAREDVDQDFIFHHIMGAEFIEHLKPLMTGSNYPAVSSNDVSTYQLHCPPLDEQQRIAEVLRSIDEVHRLNRLALAHLQLLRKFALRDFFIARDGDDLEETILGQLPLGWAAVPAEDICEAVIDCKNRTPPITETGFAVVRTPNVRDGRFVRNNLVRTDPKSFAEWTRRGQPKAGDVLITREAPIGEVCAVPEDEPICLGQRMMLYRPNKSRLDSLFLLYALQCEPVQKHLRHLGGGSTVGHVRVGDIRRLPLPCPDITTQVAVAKALQEIDVAIDRATESCSQIAILKNFAASEILHGRIRVPA